MRISKGYLSSQFYLHFINDSNYFYKNKIVQLKSGLYERINDSLILRNENEKSDWLKFKIDSLSNNKLYLSRNDYAVIFNNEIDSIAINTGEKIKIILYKLK